MFVHTVIMVIEPHMKQGRQHKLISTIFLATSVTKKLDHNKLIQECRTSGLTDKAWCERNHIQRSSLYYHIRRFRNMACEIPENPVSSCQEQHEVVAVDFSVPAESEITEQPRNETVAYAPAIRVIYSGFSVEIQNTAASETIRNTITALRQLC